jgi:hypothetical protein
MPTRIEQLEKDFEERRLKLRLQYPVTRYVVRQQLQSPRFIGLAAVYAVLMFLLRKTSIARLMYRLPWFVIANPLSRTGLVLGWLLR